MNVRQAKGGGGALGGRGSFKTAIPQKATGVQPLKPTHITSERTWSSDPNI